MKIRFQADYDFNGEVVEGLLRREPVIDLKSGHAATLEGIADPIVLEKAADEDRILIITTTGQCLGISLNSSLSARVLVFS